MSDYRKIINQSPFLANAISLYGWVPALQQRWADGIVKSLEINSDWRIAEILQIDNQMGLGLVNGGERLLEAGSGIGSLFIALRKNGIAAHGIDFSHENVQTSRKLAELSGLYDESSYQALRQGSLEDIKFPNNYFSMITCFGVLEFVDDMISVIREFLRVLKPGGILWISSSDNRFPHQTQYDIPILPYLKKELAKVWLDAYEKPLEGISRFNYISLPLCLGMTNSLGFETLKKATTSPENEIITEIDRVLGREAGDYLIDDPEKLYLLAKDVKKRCVETTRVSFSFLGRKPLKAYPGLG